MDKMYPCYKLHIFEPTVLARDNYPKHGERAQECDNVHEKRDTTLKIA